MDQFSSLWKKPLIQDTLPYLTDTEAWHEYEDIVQVLERNKSLGAETFCAVLIYADDVDMLVQTAGLPEKVAEIAAVFNRGMVTKGDNLFFTASTSAPLQIIMAEFILGVEAANEAAQSKNKKRLDDDSMEEQFRNASPFKDRTHYLRNYIMPFCEKIELCQSWTKVSPKLFQNFCAAIKDLSNLMKNETERSEICSSLQRLEKGLKGSVTPTLTADMKKIILN